MDKSKKKYTTRQRTSKIVHHHPLAISRIKMTVKLGFKSIWNHRLRSLLTALGIVFGVSSVIAMLAIAEGASYEAQEMIRQMGSNNIMVSSVKPPKPQDPGTTSQSAMLQYGITYLDVKRIKDTIPGVEIKVPARIINKDIWHKSKRVSSQIYGTVPWYTEVNKHGVAAGRFLSDVDLDTKANVCVIGSEMAKRLFTLDSPVGRTIHIGTRYYKIVGVMEPKTKPDDKSKKAGSSTKSSAAAITPKMFIPLTTIKERFGESIIERTSGSMSIEQVELHEVTVQVAVLDDVIETAKIIEAILKQSHKQVDYQVKVPLAELQMAEKTARIFNIVLGAIAGISLIVGGIGIMNIMLASVTERTREIGVRRALGAQKRDIIIQFLVETILLSGIGGLIGVALGLAIPFGVTYFAGMMTVVTFWAPAVAFSISAIVGLIFGIYPALRAANMDPVEALRHE